MLRSALACAALCGAFAASAQVATFRAPALAPAQSFSIAAPLEKAAVGEEHPGGRVRVATVRVLPKAERLQHWAAASGGFASRFDASSAGAEGLRVQLDASKLSHALEVRVQGADGRIHSMTLSPGVREAWTPWTEGDTQAVELYSQEPQAVEVTGMLHFTASPFAKAAGSCTVPTLCTTNNATLDAAIAQAKKSVMKIQFVEGGGGFLCSATLIDTPRRPAPYVLTANHCISSAAAASTVTSFWFYENTGCDTASGVNPGQVQVAGGMQLVFGNHNVDSTLLLMNGSPPSGAFFTPLDPARLAPGAAVTSISHPSGDTSRLAVGTMSGELRLVGRPQDMYGVRFSRGIIEGGSSGSGLFTLSGSTLQLRGVLSGTTIRNGGGMSCSNLNEEALYGRLEIFKPEIDAHIGVSAQGADDAPNRPMDVALDPTDTPLNQRPGQLLSVNNRRIDYAGDLDLYRFVLTAPAVVSAWTEGNNGANLDTVGNILDASGSNIEANDDEQARDNHFGITRRLEAGTYFIQVAHWEAQGTGSYNLRVRADDVEEINHTALWWNSAESGWGLNVNHQGNKVFATLFTYDANRNPTWYVMSDGSRQADGTYEGTLYATNGPAFNASGPGALVLRSVGTMRLAFFGANNATLIYTVNGVQVTKQVTRQEFGIIANCTWSAFDRSYSSNFQDLWFNPTEPGWGVNITHQGNTLFATLFTYDASGQPMWLVMSNGTLTGTGFTGPLYRTSGPPFNASPWTAATPAQVGTMTFVPPSLEEGGTEATLTYTFNGVSVTKRIQRQVFGNVKPLCD